MDFFWEGDADEFLTLIIMALCRLIKDSGVAYDENLNIIRDDDEFVFYDELTPLSPVLFEEENQEWPLQEPVESSSGIELQNRTGAHISTGGLSAMGSQEMRSKSLDVVSDLVDLVIHNCSQEALKFETEDASIPEGSSKSVVQCLEEVVRSSQTGTWVTEGRRRYRVRASMLTQDMREEPFVTNQTSNEVLLDTLSGFRSNLNGQEMLEPWYPKLDASKCTSLGLLRTDGSQMSKSLSAIDINVTRNSNANENLVSSIDIVFDWAFGTSGVLKQLAVLKLRKKVQLFVARNNDVCLPSSQSGIVSTSGVTTEEILLHLQAIFAEKLQVFINNRDKSRVSKSLRAIQGRTSEHDVLHGNGGFEGIESACPFDPLEVMSLFDSCLEELNVSFKVSIVTSDSVCALKSIDYSSNQFVSTYVRSSSNLLYQGEVMSQFASLTQNMKPRKIKIFDNHSQVAQIQLGEAVNCPPFMKNAKDQLGLKNETTGSEMMISGYGQNSIYIEEIEGKPIFHEGSIDGNMWTSNVSVKEGSHVVNGEDIKAHCPVIPESFMKSENPDLQTISTEPLSLKAAKNLPLPTKVKEDLVCTGEESVQLVLKSNSSKSAGARSLKAVDLKVSEDEISNPIIENRYEIKLETKQGRFYNLSKADISKQVSNLPDKESKHRNLSSFPEHEINVAVNETSEHEKYFTRSEFGITQKCEADFDGIVEKRIDMEKIHVVSGNRVIPASNSSEMKPIIREFKPDSRKRKLINRTAKEPGDQKTGPLCEFKKISLLSRRRKESNTISGTESKFNSFNSFRHQNLKKIEGKNDSNEMIKSKETMKKNFNACAVKPEINDKSPISCKIEEASLNSFEGSRSTEQNFDKKADSTRNFKTGCIKNETCHNLAPIAEVAKEIVCKEARQKVLFPRSPDSKLERASLIYMRRNARLSTGLDIPLLTFGPKSNRPQKRKKSSKITGNISPCFEKEKVLNCSENSVNTCELHDAIENSTSESFDNPNAAGIESEQIKDSFDHVKLEKLENDSVPKECPFSDNEKLYFPKNYLVQDAVSDSEDALKIGAFEWKIESFEYIQNEVPNFYPGTQTEEVSPYFSEEMLLLTKEDKWSMIVKGRFSEVILSSDKKNLKISVECRPSTIGNQSCLALIKAAGFEANNGVIMSWKIYVALQIGKKSLSNEIRFRAVYISCIECKCDLIIPEENDNEITRWAETEFLPCPQAIVKKLMAAPLAPKTPSLTFRPSEFLSSNQLMKQALLNSARQKILERLENDFFPDLVTPVVALRAEKDPEFPQESKTNTEISAALFAPENLVKTEDHIDDLSSDQQKTFLQSTKVTPVQDFDYGDCFQLRQSQFLDNICTPITQFSEPSQKLKTKEERNLNRNKFELNPADFVDFDDFGTDLKSKISSLLFEDETTSDFWNRNRLPNLDKEFTEKRKLMMNQPMPALGKFARVQSINQNLKISIAY